jgi:hypothetical protein
MDAITTSEAAKCRRPRAAAGGDPVLCCEILERGNDERRRLELFIARGFLRAYGAVVAHFADQLVALRRPGESWSWYAAFGYTLAGADRLFVEQYLDVSSEHAISARLGIAIERSDVVEVGNLAASLPGAARAAVVCMGALLPALRRRWVVCTATRALRNCFARLDIGMVELGRAEAARLPDGGACWGSYYTHDPRVIAVNAPLALLRLASRAENRTIRSHEPALSLAALGAGG